MGGACRKQGGDDSCFCKIIGKSEGKVPIWKCEPCLAQNKDQGCAVVDTVMGWPSALYNFSPCFLFSYMPSHSNQPVTLRLK
jgi:hypothetical protein